MEKEEKKEDFLEIKLTSWNDYEKFEKDLDKKFHFNIHIGSSSAPIAGTFPKIVSAIEFLAGSSYVASTDRQIWQKRILDAIHDDTTVNGYCFTLARKS